MTGGQDREVAVVDDDAAVLDSFRFMLELAGFPVATYASPLDFLARGGAAPRCLILDHHMPVMTGLELVARLHEDGVSIPILLVTAVTSPALRARAEAFDVRCVLEKPPTEAELIDFVQSC